MTDPLAAEIAKFNEEYMSSHSYYAIRLASRIMSEQNRRLDLASEALKALTEYVQEQASLHNLDWQVLADNKVLVEAIKALAALEGK